MLLNEVEYARPESVAEALELLASNDNARALAGGQTLVNVMKQRLAAPDLLVDLAELEELTPITVGARRRARARRDGDALGRDRLGRGGGAAADPGRGRLPSRGRAGAKPRHGWRQRLLERPDQSPAAADGGCRSDDDHRRRRRHAIRSGGGLLPRRLHDSGRARRAPDEDLHSPGGRHGRRLLLGHGRQRGHRDRERGRDRERRGADCDRLRVGRAGAGHVPAGRRQRARSHPRSRISTRPSDVHGSGEYRRHLAGVLALRAVGHARSSG